MYTNLFMICISHGCLSFAYQRIVNHLYFTEWFIICISHGCLSFVYHRDVYHLYFIWVVYPIPNLLIIVLKFIYHCYNIVVYHLFITGLLDLTFKYARWFIICISHICLSLFSYGCLSQGCSSIVYHSCLSFVYHRVIYQLFITVVYHLFITGLAYMSWEVSTSVQEQRAVRNIPEESCALPVQDLHHLKAESTQTEMLWWQ